MAVWEKLGAKFILNHIFDVIIPGSGFVLDALDCAEIVEVADTLLTVKECHDEVKDGVEDILEIKRICQQNIRSGKRTIKASDIPKRRRRVLKKCFYCGMDPPNHLGPKCYKNPKNVRK